MYRRYARSQTIPANLDTTLITTPIIAKTATNTPVANDVPPTPPKPDANYRRRALLFLLPILLLLTAGTALVYRLKNNNANTTTVAPPLAPPAGGDSPVATSPKEETTTSPKGATAPSPEGETTTSPPIGGGKGGATTDALKTANTHRNNGEYAKALKECDRILHDPRYPRPKILDTYLH